jgi:short subunit dehydrogenase-like uncharacterized protein
MPAAERDLDIVVYGASGFVGRLVAEYLARAAPEGVRIGLAGRSKAKLSEVRDSLGAAAAGWPIITADAGDAAALDTLAKSTKVVTTTVGPYAKYGIPLVAACAANGTHYADLTGEVLFVRRCIDEFDEAARATGARIVNSCGFDSVPSDVGVYETFRFAEAQSAGGLTDTTLVLTGGKGGFSGGTIDSLRNQIEVISKDSAARAIVGDPFSLSPDRTLDPPRARSAPDNDSVLPTRDSVTGIWQGPFVMAPFNTRIVRRSNAIADYAYGDYFHYREVVGFGTSPLGPVLASGMAVGMAGLVAGMGFGPTRAVLNKVLPSPGEGPSAQARANGYFSLDIYANTDSGTVLRTHVAAKGDPGYAATSVMIGESALSLAFDGADLPDRAGVLTPATAMGSALSNRLRAAGFTIDPGVYRP